MTSTLNHKAKTRMSKFDIRNSIFEFSWRLAIIILPWQTRWFADASLAGWPWEQARISIYVSFLPIIATIIIAQFLPKQDLAKHLRQAIFYLVAALGLITVVNNLADIRPVTAWWLQIFLLLSFFITLVRANIKTEQVLFWFIVALIPHAVLALIQFYTQYVPGWSLLGIAAQDPASLGVSVVQTDGLRFLRAYGGFPHPNILGGFMVFGVVASAWSYLYIKKLSIFYLALLPVFSFGLFYSFSRSAWLALAIGMIFLIGLSLVEKDVRKTKELKIIVATLLTMTVLSVIHSDLVSARLGFGHEPARLEQQSISARTASLKDGIKIFQAHPILGTGPNSELPALAEITAPFNKGKRGELTVPLEPPHNTWLLMIISFGAVGALFIFGFLLFIFRQIFKYWSISVHCHRCLLISLITTWLVISIFDYYLWAFWSGQLLTILTLYIIIFWLNKNQKANSTVDLEN